MDIERINSVLVKAIMGFQEEEIEAMAEATAGGYKVPSPDEVAAKAKKKEEPKKCSHRNKKGDFPNYDACVDHMDECEGHADPKGICAAIMFGGKRKKKADDEDEE